MCISKSGHEHAHVEEQTPMRKFRGRLFTSGAHRCVPLRNARELCSRCAALFTRWLAARSYVFEHSVCVHVLRIAWHSSLKSISTCIHTWYRPIGNYQSETYLGRHDSCDSFYSDRNYHRLFVGRGKEESSIERIGPKSTLRISTYSMYSICNPFPSLAMSQRIAETRDRLNIARQFEKRHQRPHRGVTRAESKWYRR